MQEILEALGDRLRGEVRLDEKHRILYATDASLYQQLPRGVVFPRDDEDVAAALDIARQAGLPVLPRGGGTSLAGQTTAEGALVLDFSRHMDQLLALDVEGRRARIQPGLVLDDLNARLAPHGLRFGPDVAPSNRATLGGMAGNNSCGAHSLLYGKMVENVEAVTALLATGERLDLGPLPRTAARERARRSGAEGRVFSETLAAAEENAEAIRARYPKIPRRVSGYNLDLLLPEEGADPDFNLARLLVGSEGTLGLSLELTLELVEAPRARGMSVLAFGSLLEALRAAPAIAREGPAAVEVLDRWLLGLALDSPGYRQGLAFLADDPPGAVLMVEHFAEDPAALKDRLERFESTVVKAGMARRVWSFDDEASQQALWKARKAGLGLLMSMKGDAKPVAFVEDTAVPPDRLADYTEEFLGLVEQEGARCAVYGHAAAGCLHTRPILAVKDPEDRAALRRISEGVARLVARYGGCMSGEHGDGLSRSRYLQDSLGPEIVAAFTRVKQAFDPEGRMNPGKITAAPEVTDRLRQGDGYRTAVPETAFRFEAEGGMDRSVELCNGMAVCRKRGAGTMCPSFMALREEEHATRGRANLLRAALDGRLDGGLSSPDLHDALALCLECKACKTECPTQVDLAKLKEEALHQRARERGHSLADRLIGRLDRHLALASRFPRLADALPRLPGARWALERLTGLDRRRPLPRLSTAAGRPAGPFARRAWQSAVEEGQPGTDETRGVVALFVDTFNDAFEPDTALAAARVLQWAGYQVLPAGLACCGRTRIARGMLEEAADLARANAPRLERWADEGVPVVGLEPSCLLTLRDDLPDLRGVELSPQARDNLVLFDELLAGQDLPWPDGLEETGLRLHTHCHQRALVGTSPGEKLLQGTGVRVLETGAGCCGMAGAFGYEHHDLSRAVAADRFLPALDQARAAGEAVLAPGFSCRQQARDLAGVEAVHPAVWLERRIREAGRCREDCAGAS